MLHVLAGENSDQPMFDDCVRRGLPVSWIVPKKAEPGDTALFVFHRDRFVGKGIIVGEPESTTFLGRPAYRALVSDLVQFRQPLAVDDVSERVPKWGWPASSTRRLTTPDNEIARQLERIMADHVVRVGLKQSRAATDPARKNRKTSNGRTVALASGLQKARRTKKA